MKSAELQYFARLLMLTQRSEQTPGSNSPSEEELAELLEGKMAFKRKQEVYALLNRNPDLFAKWIRLVEAKHDVCEGVSANQSQGWISRLLGWLPNVSYGQKGLAATAVVIFSFFLIPTDFLLDTENQWNTINNEIGGIGPDNVQAQLRDLVKAVENNCPNLMSTDEHRNQYRLMLLAVQAELGRKSLPKPETFEQLQSNIYSDVGRLCSFNTKLFNEL
tara:strand:- start:1163 stop:1819 length:657 start_codon:yes stop_codon:yes gene_type:complete